VHELSVCQALLIQVEDLARGKAAVSVERITIECGSLSGVEPTLLKDAFAIMRLGGIAAAAELVVLSAGVCIECIECGGRNETMPNRLLCAACGGFRTRVISGGELRLRKVEMRTYHPPPVGAA
jgi:hydrogenase nickel incorporation protein HypA/HybF